MQFCLGGFSRDSPTLWGTGHGAIVSYNINLCQFFTNLEIKPIDTQVQQPVQKPQTQILHSIETPEGLSIELELAGVGNRITACLIDTVIFSVLVAMVLIAIGIGYAVSSQMPSGAAKDTIQEVVTTLAFVVPGILLLVFQFLQEWLWGGRSIGKSLMHIRVVRKNGQPIGFWEAFGRHLMRLFDVMMSGIGLFPMFITRSEQRFGDLLVGSIVIHDNPTELETVQMRFQLVDPPEELLEAGERMSSEEYYLLQDLLKRRSALGEPHKHELEAAFKGYFQQRYGLTEGAGQYRQYFEALYTGFHRAGN